MGFGFNQHFLEEIEDLPPMAFFDMHGHLPYASNPGKGALLKKPFLLPELDFDRSKPGASLGAAWNEEGLIFDIEVNKAFEQASFADPRSGDAISLLIDTRDFKTNLPTRFSHHFVVLPQAIEDHYAKELTRFRGEDRHPLCEPEILSVLSEIKKNSYALRVFLPSEALTGFSPDRFNLLGLAYRINFYGSEPQIFPKFENSIEDHPLLWASYEMVRKYTERDSKIGSGQRES